jgi:PAS domain S-box-containing protein
MTSLRQRKLNTIYWIQLRNLKRSLQADPGDHVMAIDTKNTNGAVELRTEAEAKVAVQAAVNASLSDLDVKRLYHELQIHQVELEIQNAVLTSTKCDLEATRDSYFDLYDLAPVGYLTLNKDGVIQRANLTAATMLGTITDDLIYRPIQKFIFSDDVDSYYLQSRSSVEVAEDFTLELRLVQSDGTPFWVNLQASLQNNDDLWLALSNISDRKQLEQSLRRANDTLEELVAKRTEELTTAVIRLQQEIEDRKKAEHALQFERDLSLDIINAEPAGIYRIRVFAPDTWKNDAWRSSKSSPYVVELVSEPFCTILDTTKEVFENNPGKISDLIYPDDREGFAKKNEAAAVLLEEFFWEGRLLIDGMIKWVRFQSLPRPLENGDILWTGALTDITERKQAEEDKLALEQQLQQAQRLESLGVLAGGIAHDFNNILTVIISSCSLAQIRPNMTGDLLPEIEKAAQRAADLCRQMLAYAGKSHMNMKKIKMTALVDDMLKMLRSTINQNVVITTDISADLPVIIGDSSQLRQVIMNLIVNAAEAIGDAQGEVRVSLSKKVLNKDGAEKDYFGKIIPHGCYACLEVADSGCGMNDETYNRIFEPFYTTKFTGRGLGMSAVLGIIKTHNGAFQLSSEPGKGTTFKIFLPVQITAGEESLQHVSSATWQGSGTILLAEDEEQIKLVAKAMLETLGFTVIEASNGKEALELYRKNAADINLVITDLGMPVMDGYQLFRELKALRPDLPIIISSGFGDTVVESRIARKDRAGSISKPYSFDRLREELKRVVEGIQKPA